MSDRGRRRIHLRRHDPCGDDPPDRTRPGHRPDDPRHHHRGLERLLPGETPEALGGSGICQLVKNHRESATRGFNFVADSFLFGASTMVRVLHQLLRGDSEITNLHHRKTETTKKTLKYYRFLDKTQQKC